MALADKQFARFCTGVYIRHRSDHVVSIYASNYIGSQQAFVEHLLKYSIGYGDKISNGAKIFKGNRPVSTFVSDAPNPIDKKKLKEFLRDYLCQTCVKKQSFDDRCRIIWTILGFPQEWEFNAEHLMDALTDWMQAIIHEPDNCDVLHARYQCRLAEQGDPDRKTVDRAYYSGDDFYVERRTTIVKKATFYETFTHTWKITNMGRSSWQNRVLVCQNPKDIALRPIEVKAIEVPYTEPKATATIEVEMKAQGREGTAISEWRMYDQNDNDCFPTLTSSFNIEVEVINPNRKPKGGIR